jgi:hypothetical protein
MINSKKTEELLELAREQFSSSESADSMAREEAQEDLCIYEGEGIWDERLRSARTGDPKGARPCLTISDLPPRVRQVTNDVRQNKPSIKIRPVDSGADLDTAEIFNGIFRHIEQQSMADIAYETANFYQVVGGFGYFRLVEGFSPEENQRELYIRPVPNPFAVYMDPLSLCPVASTARYCFIAEDMLKKEFEREYGDKDEVVGWNDGYDGDDMLRQGWYTEETVRVAEWMNIEEVSKKYLRTEKGALMSEDEYLEQPEDVRDRIIETKWDRHLRCVWRKITGNRILKEITLPISYIPVFRVPGEMYIKGGKTIYKGLVRDSRDAVRMVSYTFSSYIESISVQTKTPYIVAAGQLDGFEADWAASNIENAPALQYNPITIDGTNALPPPARQDPPMASQGIIQGLILAQQALKDVTGMGAASLGQKGNEVSGKAILARQKEGDVGSYHYADNLAKAIRHLGRVGLQWIPHVYNERKVIRIISEDSTTEMVDIDQDQAIAKREIESYDFATDSRKIKKIYNLGIGCYDVVTTVGPSFSTRREEATTMMSQMFQSNPQLVQLVGDIFLENQDMPGAQRMAKRLKAALPPQIAAVDDEKSDIPPQVQMQMQQMQAQLQEGAQLMQQLQGENADLAKKLEDKAADIQAKVHDTDVRYQAAELKAQSDLAIAQLAADSKESIAHLQAQVDRMEAVLRQQAAMAAVAARGTGARSPETP